MGLRYPLTLTGSMYGRNFIRPYNSIGVDRVMDQGQDREDVVHNDEATDQGNDEGNLVPFSRGAYQGMRPGETYLQIIAMPRKACLDCSSPELTEEPNEKHEHGQLQV